MVKTILIVDDSRTMRHMVSSTLKKSGLDVFEAADGEIAMELLSALKVDLIISDLHMPNMDGLELVSNVRAAIHNKDVPILLLTTESDSKKKEHGKSAGATGWMIKPFNPETLTSVVHKVINME